MSQPPPIPSLDRRRNAFRADVAAEKLRGLVEAERFVTGLPHQVMRASIAMRRDPSASAGLETEVLFGEVITVFDVANGWAWGQLERDGYVGYVPAEALATQVTPPTHRVSAIGTFLYAGADIKSPPLMHLSLNSQLTVVDTTDRFSRLAQGGFVVSRHIAPAGKIARDFVEIGERLIGTPYLWGGRTRIGVDCSGLVQMALEAAGVPCPRDTDMQQAEVGADVLVPEPLDGLVRGDLVFWRGHVGVMSDGVMLLHANAHHMAVVVEPLVAAIQRNVRSGSSVVAIKRPGAIAA